MLLKKAGKLFKEGKYKEAYSLYKQAGERYGEDHSYDDNEILTRIDRLKLVRHMVAEPMIVHLYHPIFYLASPYKGQKNLNLFNNITKTETRIKIQELEWNKYKSIVTEYE